MTQPPYPSPPYPPAPYHPHARQPPDPAAPAKRASVLMWVLGTIAVLFGSCLAAALPWMLDTMLASGPPAEVEQLRAQIAQVEAQTRVPIHTQLLASGVVVIAIGGVLGLLAFFVRAGGRAAAVTAAVFVGLVLGFFVLNTLTALVVGGNPGQVLMSVCLMVVPLALLGLVMHWLVQAARNAPQVEAARRWSAEHGRSPDPWDAERRRQQSQPPGGPAGHEVQPPPPPAPHLAYPPAPPPPVPGPLFGPAPFGIPPPPDEAAPGRYGYATRPPAAPPAPAPPPAPTADAGPAGTDAAGPADPTARP